MKAGNRDRGQENGQEGKDGRREGTSEENREREKKKGSQRNGTVDRYVPIQLPTSLNAAELHLIREVQTVPSSEGVRAYNLPS